MIKCGTCKKCCQWGDEGHKIGAVLRTREALAGKHKFHRVGGVCRLDAKRNGDCTYLGEDGCTIHDAKPHSCTLFDCRELYLATNKNPFLRILCEGAIRSEDVT